MKHALAAIVGIAVLAACGATSTSSSPATQTPLATNGLTEVDLSSTRPLPPPYTPKHRALTSTADIELFQQMVAAHAITLSSSSSGVTAGCTGGTEYTITMVRAAGPPSTLGQCADRISANISGTDLSGFLAEIDQLLA